MLEHGIELIRGLAEKSNVDDAKLLNDISDFLESIGWCDEHGKPHQVVQEEGCEDCLGEESGALEKDEDLIPK